MNDEELSETEAVEIALFRCWLAVREHRADDLETMFAAIPNLSEKE